ncbi:phage holin family protein [Streptomyces sp. NPDC051219]|uniref:phage holin family protein n=1 Tax=Streptomyces sp. NPDC051219 TaxID=3155283 RepID=UPI003422A593
MAVSPEPSVGELVKQASEQLSDLVREELALARAELKDKGRRAGRGGGLYGGAGIMGLFAFQALVVAAIAALALVIPVWAAGLVVAGLLAVLAALLALLGRKETRRATPLAPERTVESVRADIHELKERTHR